MTLKPAEILPLTYTQGVFPLTPANPPLTPANGSANALTPKGVIRGRLGAARIPLVVGRIEGRTIPGERHANLRIARERPRELEVKAEQSRRRWKANQDLSSQRGEV